MITYERDKLGKNVLTNQIGFYDNDCLDTYGANDRNSHNTFVEVNASNPNTFYHLNYHGDLPLAAQLYAKQWVWSIDRINELYTIQWVDIWTNEWTTLTNTQWSEDNASSRASRWCHTDTGTVAPLINTGFLDGTIIPTAWDLWTGWSTTCDGNSRWVLSYMTCIDSLYAPSQSWTACAWAPSRYQFRINVTPTQAPDLMCIASATTSAAIPNTSYVYMTKNNNGSWWDTIFLYNTWAWGYVWTADQQSYITKTSPDLLLTGWSIFQQLYGPNTLFAWQSGEYVYVWQNYSVSEMTWSFSVQIPMIWGQCPEVSNVSSGFVFNPLLCSITGEIQSWWTGEAIQNCQENLSSRTEYTYDDAWNEILQISYLWDTLTNSWRPSSKIERNYNSSWLIIITNKQYAWDIPTNNWRNGTKTQWTYDSNWNQIWLDRYFWNTVNNNWMFSIFY